MSGRFGRIVFRRPADRWQNQCRRCVPRTVGDHPARLPEVTDSQLAEEVVHVDLTKPVSEIRAAQPISCCTRVMLTGPMVVARDIAHAKLKEVLDSGKPLPDYIKNHPVYYAGPAKTPEGYALVVWSDHRRSNGLHVDLFQANGGSLVMLAKGNRSRQVRDACEARWLLPVKGPRRTSLRTPSGK